MQWSSPSAGKKKKKKKCFKGRFAMIFLLFLWNRIHTYLGCRKCVSGESKLGAVYTWSMKCKNSGLNFVTCSWLIACPVVVNIPSFPMVHSLCMRSQMLLIFSSFFCSWYRLHDISLCFELGILNYFGSIYSLWTV